VAHTKSPSGFVWTQIRTRITAGTWVISFVAHCY